MSENTPATAGKTKTPIRLKRLMSLTTYGKSTIHNRMNPASPYYCPDFPKQVSLHGNIKVWILEEVEEWLQARMQARTQI